MGRAFLPFELAMQRLAEFADFKLHTLRCSSCANVYLLVHLYDELHWLMRSCCAAVIVWVLHS
ncbi:hypothetical protein M513_12668 [Trichuris suis]|uniref:Uncharacterized protein n=1 Tax=Trichuris suis TaxID=68888 RepID=A0A085LNC1_9BILA|nr:hypothetical protein M513_12668 [Trichuris suis]